MIAFFFIDTKGRRWLLMPSLALMFPFLVGTAFSFQATEGSTRQKGLIATFLVLYTMVSNLLKSSDFTDQVPQSAG